MSSHPLHLVIGVVLLALTLAARVASTNRLVRSKLRLSILLLVVDIALNAFLTTTPVDPELDARVLSVDQLLLALAAINLGVVVVINPLRMDRVPERFPNILQDAIIIGLFGVVATVVMREKFLTTSAVGAVVIGFALQDTLGNAFAGLAIQIDRPYRLGDWIQVGAFEGFVTQITWRATKLRTKWGNFVVVPNNIISKEAITNYSEPLLPTRLFIDVGCAYGAPPNQVKDIIRESLNGVPLVLLSPPAEVVVNDFGNSAIVYRVQFWIEDYAKDYVARDQVRCAIYYALRRQGIEIPFPIQVEIQRKEQGGRTDTEGERFKQILERVDLFHALSPEERGKLVDASGEHLYGDGEAVVKQADSGSSMFVICSGKVRVVVEPSGHEVASIPAGGYFGEMSMLTGEPRSASVYAAGDCVVLEITADTLRGAALANPAVVERISSAVSTRRADLEKQKLAAVSATPAAQSSPQNFLARVRQFLRLP